MLRKEMRNASIFLTDAEYVCPNTPWLRGKFWNTYRSWAMKNFVMKWQTFDDCDNKAALFQVLICIAHSHAMQKRDNGMKMTAQGIAVGTMDYLIGGDKKKGHCINIFISGGEVKFLEPQNGKVLKLTQKEKDSCWHVRL